jgi:hypothetical protein
LIAAAMSQKHRLSIGLPIKRSDPVKILLPALLFPVIVLGQEIQPFDRLGRDNVTIQAQHKRGGSSSNYDYRTSWGSYSKTVTSTKEIEVTIKQHRKEKQKPLVVEFFFIIKGEAGALHNEPARSECQKAKERRRLGLPQNKIRHGMSISESARDLAIASKVG